MALNFNSRGFLHQTIGLTYEEFKKHFGTNPKRMQQINNALVFFMIFNSCNCKTVYIDGSFVSKKEYPEDIDLCFDITDLDEEKLKREFPSFFDPNQLGKIHKETKCHILFFSTKDTTLLDLLKKDRDGNPKGLVKLDLKDLKSYDQK